MEHFQKVCSNSFGYFVAMFVSVMMLSGCPDFETHKADDKDEFSMEKGGMTPVINLPIPAGKSFQCVQGVNGSFSHQDKATKFDIDFDTPNNSDEDIFAPVSGRAYPHTKNSSKNFGNHLNIDLGNGTYVVVAHLSELFVSSVRDVEAGELIGLEGCSGYCTGDHVHIGLHSGNAVDVAEYGTSMPAKYLVSDKTAMTNIGAVAGSDLVCGIVSMGDKADGHFYESALGVNKWHPNGTLVKSAKSNKVYLVAQDLLHWIENEKVFWSFKYSFDDVIQISEDEFECYAKGNSISTEGFFDAFVDSVQQMWLVVGNEKHSFRYRIRVRETAWKEVLFSWGLVYSNYDKPTHVSAGAIQYMNWPIKSGYAQFRSGTLVKEKSRSDVYVVSEYTAVPVKDYSTFRLMGYSDKNILTVQDGEISVVMGAVGSCSVSTWCLTGQMARACGSLLVLDDEPSSEIQASSYKENEPEETVEEPVEESSSEEKVSTGDSFCGGKDVCISNGKIGTVNNALFFSSSAWIADAPKNKTAHIYDIGSCFDTVLDYSDTASISSGWYMVEFSKKTQPCTGILTLVSDIGTDGNPPNNEMTNWYWLQNAPFCSKGSELCQLMKNNTSWEEWLIAVSWDPKTGLIAAGNGLTSNKQLN